MRVGVCTSSAFIKYTHTGTHTYTPVNKNEADTKNKQRKRQDTPTQHSVGHVVFFNVEA